GGAALTRRRLGGGSVAPLAAAGRSGRTTGLALLDGSDELALAHLGRTRDAHAGRHLLQLGQQHAAQAATPASGCGGCAVRGLAACRVLRDLCRVAHEDGPFSWEPRGVMNNLPARQRRHRTDCLQISKESYSIAWVPGSGCCNTSGIARVTKTAPLGRRTSLVPCVGTRRRQRVALQRDVSRITPSL